MNVTLTILTKANYLKAQIISRKLEEAGIVCFFKSANKNIESIPSELDIYVNEGDLGIANKFLNDLNSETKFSNQTIQENIVSPDLIIVPVDYSQASHNACIYSLELASVLNARLKLIHTYGLPETRPMSFDDTDFYSGTLTQYISDIREEAEKSMAELHEDLKNYVSEKKLGSIPINTSIVNGLPDEITLFTAESDKAGLIIMGITKKDTRLFGPMGKIASRIIERVKIPVLAIPEESVFKGITNINNILYITTFDESDFSGIQKLFNIVDNLNTHIYFLHISNNRDNDPWDKIKMEGLKEYFSNVYKRTNVSCELMYSDNIIEALDNFIRLNKIDIISIITHKQNIISKLINPDITRKILYYTKIPLLVFHP